VLHEADQEAETLARLSVVPTTSRGSPRVATFIGTWDRNFDTPTDELEVGPMITKSNDVSGHQLTSTERRAFLNIKSDGNHLTRD